MPSHSATEPTTKEFAPTSVTPDGSQTETSAAGKATTEPTTKVFAPTNVTPNGSQTKTPSCLPVLVYNTEVYGIFWESNKNFNFYCHQIF